jgi:hypothetical protein
MPTCRLTGQEFIVSPFEKKLREEFGFPDPDMLPHFRIRHLMAFWPHWALHKRKCDKTGKEIISIFRPDCAYPVWHKDEWYSSANPPSENFNFEEAFFPQAERLFKRCPIAHTIGTNSENCEYTDDWWFSRDCYLCHCGVYCENTRNSYRIIHCKDTTFATFCFECENSIDIINCEKCYACVYSLYLKNCRDVSFCYDCR